MRKNAIYSQENSEVSLTPATLVLFRYLATPCTLQDLSSLYLETTCAPSSGSMEFNRWDRQGSPASPATFSLVSFSKIQGLVIRLEIHTQESDLFPSVGISPLSSIIITAKRQWSSEAAQGLCVFKNIMEVC